MNTDDTTASGQARKNASVSSFSFIASNPAVEITRHHCYHLCVSISKPYDCIVNGKKLTNVWGIIVNKHVPHSCHEPDVAILIHFIDPVSLWGRSLKHMLNGAAYLELSEFMEPDTIQNIIPADYTKMQASEIQPYAEAFLGKLLMPYQSLVKTERETRVDKALKYIGDNMHSKLTLNQVAEQLFLSPDRARHLFTEQVEVPFKQYIIWIRIRNATIAMIHRKVSPVKACTEYGFTDYSHFSRMFKQMFGVPPGSIFNYSRIMIF